MLTWKIAWRNLWRHKGKSLIIGVILCAGAFLMTAGNALLDGAMRGLEKNMIAWMTGHLVVTSIDHAGNDLFMQEEPMADITNYPAVRAFLKRQEYVEDSLPITRGGMMIFNETGRNGEAFVFGVNFEDYQRFFGNNVTAVEGGVLKNGGRGIMISDETRDAIFDRQKFWVLPEGAELNPERLTPRARKRFDKLGSDFRVARDLVVMGAPLNSVGTDVRLPVKGIFRFKQFNKLWGMNNLMDIESYRECFGYLTAAERAVTLSRGRETLLNAEGDALFAADMVDVARNVSTKAYDVAKMQKDTRRTDRKIDLDDGVYNMVFIRLGPGVSVDEGKELLTGALRKADLGVRVLTWKESMGEGEAISDIVQGALFLFVMFVFFVAMLIIMNTLIIAVMERTQEIGMMRAVGARRGFISGMLLAENAQLALAFGGSGILLGILLSLGLAALRISVADNEVLSLLCGGDVFRPVISASGIGLGAVQLAIAAFLSVIYPVRVARRITPLEAIARD